MRNWEGTLFDQRAKPDSYLAWHDRALGALSGNRPDVRRLLLWAEQPETPLDAAAELRGARAVALVYDEVASVSLTFFEGTKALLAESLLDTARTCGDGRGLELWRRLAAQWRGNAPQVLAAKSRRYFDPQRCSTAAKLWDALPPWEQLGSEIALGLPPGEALPDLLRAQALEKLVPEALLQVIWSRPELTAAPAAPPAPLPNLASRAKAALSTGSNRGTRLSTKPRLLQRDRGIQPPPLTLRGPYRDRWRPLDGDRDK